MLRFNMCLHHELLLLLLLLLFLLLLLLLLFSDLRYNFRDLLWSGRWTVLELQRATLYC